MFSFDGQDWCDVYFSRELKRVFTIDGFRSNFMMCTFSDFEGWRHI
jgi:hypothetical protein